MSGDGAARQRIIERLARADPVALKATLAVAKLQLGGEEQHEATITVALIEAVGVYRFGSRWVAETKAP
jgi:hypothetical protein